MLRCLATVTLLSFSAITLRADDLTAKLDAILDRPEYAAAKWGVLVVEAKTGKTVYERNPDKMATPASVTKLYSCAAALMAFGPDYKFETPVYRRGEVSSAGFLRGDLILVASGDLTFGGRTGVAGKCEYTNGDHTYANSGLSTAILTNTNPLAGLEALAKQIADSGIKEVQGDVLIDDRLFAKARGSGSGPDAVSPILVNDNIIDVIVTPGDKPGDRATVATRPVTAFAQTDFEVVTSQEGTSPSISVNATGSNAFSVRGRIPVKSQPFVRIYAVEDPALYARCLFIECLRKAGVRVNAPLNRPSKSDWPDTYEKLAKIATFTSPPLSEAIKVTLKVSHNLYASTLPCLVAAKEGKKTAEQGLAIQGKLLKDLGVDVKTISFGGGAGGQQADCVTPRATVQLLQGMRKRPEWEAYRNGFPTLGVDGTLHDVINKDGPGAGKAFGKTGTLIWNDAMNGRSLLRSKALAGVTTTAKGTDLTFAIFVNDVPLPPGVGSAREGKTLGSIAEAIHVHGP
jgi:D-alanyl-D-alanine carboxypeptidase/D-alanyl-D-alanine-endopeptidase (penicillin-binding protein 4)